MFGVSPYVSTVEIARFKLTDAPDVSKLYSSGSSGVGVVPPLVEKEYVTVPYHNPRLFVGFTLIDFNGIPSNVVGTSANSAAIASGASSVRASPSI